MTGRAGGRREPGEMAASVDVAEVERFSALAGRWWNPDGEFRALHRLNPIRVAFVRDHVAAHFGRNPEGPRPLAGLTLLDVGCGGGLLCEPMARLGARVTGIDASARNIGIARTHAAEAGLDIEYRHAAAEDLAAAGESFDVVLSMEVIEHVANVAIFLGACAKVMVPGGCMVLATLNRTPKSFALAIVAAEYVLRWLPPGTHDWRRFVRPSELAAALRKAGLDIAALSGVAYNPFNDRWTLADDLGVNYIAFVTRSDARPRVPGRADMP